jgi:hypothetical protein
MSQSLVETSHETEILNVRGYLKLQDAVITFFTNIARLNFTQLAPRSMTSLASLPDTERRRWEFSSLKFVAC